MSRRVRRDQLKLRVNERRKRHSPRFEFTRVQRGKISSDLKLNPEEIDRSIVLTCENFRLAPHRASIRISEDPVGSSFCERFSRSVLLLVDFCATRSRPRCTVTSPNRTVSLCFLSVSNFVTGKSDDRLMYIYTHMVRSSRQLQVQRSSARARARFFDPIAYAHRTMHRRDSVLFVFRALRSPSARIFFKGKHFVHL